MTIHPDVLAHANETRRLASQLTPHGRADLLLDVTEAIYNAVKHDHPEGGGLDGRDGPERQSLGRIVDAAWEHHDETFQRPDRNA